MINFFFFFFFFEFVVCCGCCRGLPGCSGQVRGAVWQVVGAGLALVCAFRIVFGVLKFCALVPVCFAGLLAVSAVCNGLDGQSVVQAILGHVRGRRAACGSPGAQWGRLAASWVNRQCPVAMQRLPGYPVSLQPYRTPSPPPFFCPPQFIVARIRKLSFPQLSQRRL